MAESKTRPVSFRVSVDVLETLEAAGKSPAEISRAALEREARIARQAEAFARLRASPIKLRFEGDVAEFIRRDRESH